jgi:hypothetical protein
MTSLFTSPPYAFFKTNMSNLFIPTLYINSSSFKVTTYGTLPVRYCKVPSSQLLNPSHSPGAYTIKLFTVVLIALPQ